MGNGKNDNGQGHQAPFSIGGDDGQKSRSKYAPGAIVGQPPGGSGSSYPESSMQRVKPSVMTPDFGKKPQR